MPWRFMPPGKMQSVHMEAASLSCLRRTVQVRNFADCLDGISKGDSENVSKSDRYWCKCLRRSSRGR